MSTLDMVNAAISGDKEAFQTAFNATFADKVTDSLEVKKVEIATSLITPEVETNELEADKVEVDGESEGSDESSDETTTETNNND